MTRPRRLTKARAAELSEDALGLHLLLTGDGPRFKSPAVPRLEDGAVPYEAIVAHYGPGARRRTLAALEELRDAGGAQETDGAWRAR